MPPRPNSLLPNDSLNHLSGPRSNMGNIYTSFTVHGQLYQIFTPFGHCIFMFAFSQPQATDGV